MDLLKVEIKMFDTGEAHAVRLDDIVPYLCKLRDTICIPDAGLSIDRNKEYVKVSLIIRILETRIDQHPTIGFVVTALRVGAAMHKVVEPNVCTCTCGFPKRVEPALLTFKEAAKELGIGHHSLCSLLRSLGLIIGDNNARHTVNHPRNKGYFTSTRSYYRVRGNNTAYDKIAVTTHGIAMLQAQLTKVVVEERSYAN